MMQAKGRPAAFRDRPRMNQPFSCLLRQAASSLLCDSGKQGLGINAACADDTQICCSFTHQPTTHSWESSTAFNLCSHSSAAPSNRCIVCDLQAVPTISAMAFATSSSHSHVESLGPDYAFLGSRAGDGAGLAWEPAQPADGPWRAVGSGAAPGWAADDPFHADWPHW